MPLGSILSAIGNIGGSLINQANAKRNIKLQKQFAQEGIRWKVEDAKAAGIHPLYALGANTTSFQPVSVGDTASAFAGVGQDLSRAIDATRTGEERTDAYSTTVQGLQLRRMGLENELLAAQIAKVRQAGQPPGIPGALPPEFHKVTTPEWMSNLMFGGHRVDISPRWSNAQSYEDRYGEGISDYIVGPLIAADDLLRSTQPGFRHIMDRIRAGGGSR